MTTKYLFYFAIYLFMTIACSSVYAVPIVSAVTPTNGPITGGNVVTITGSGFTGTTAVTFGTRPATSFVVLNDATITATVPAGTVGTVDVLVTAGSVSTANPNDYYSYTNIGWEGIISSFSPQEVYGFNTTTMATAFMTPLPMVSMSSIMTPDGTRIYTANSVPPGVSVIDRATNTIIATIPTTAGPNAFDIIINPAGTRAYVSNLTSGIVTVIDTTNNTVVTNINVGGSLGPLSITPDGSTVYVSNFTFGVITSIDTATNTVGISIPTGTSPGMISITPDGTKAFVANFLGDTVAVVDLATQTVTNTIPFPAGSGPYGSSIPPNGINLYVININNSTVTVIDVASETIVTTIPLAAGLMPFWAAATPDSSTVYVINETNDQVTPIDTATNTAGAPFPTNAGDQRDLSMSPDPAPVARFTANPQPVGTPTTFDASASLSPIGTIVSYSWDFGDGNTLVTASPFTNHIYMTSGLYNVTLTVTNSAGTSTTQVFSSRFMSNNGGPTAIISHLLLISNVFPPINPSGFQIECLYPTQTDVVNILRWSAPASGDKPVSYRIYRDPFLTQLIGVVPATGQLRFEDHNRVRGVVYTYYIVSVDSLGGTSAPLVIIVNP